MSRLTLALSAVVVGLQALNAQAPAPAAHDLQRKQRDAQADLSRAIEALALDVAVKGR